MGLEGVISKRRDCPFRSGRRDGWLKIKCVQRQEFVVAGYLLSTVSSKAIGALVLGVYESGTLVDVGRVGTGFTESTARALWNQLQPLRTSDPPFVERLPNLARKGVIWVRGELVTEVKYRGWTSDGLLRHASFKGLRDDKDPHEVVRDETDRKAAPVATKASAAEPVRFRPENIQTLYPEAVVPSDEQLTAYWGAVGDEALKYLRRHP